MAKKTNFISYELKRLEGYLRSLTQFLDDHPPHLMEDRVEMMTSTNGNPILKVIASREAQLKSYVDVLERLPKIELAINELRKSVDDEEAPVVRGGVDIPGFMQGRSIPKADDIEFEDIPNTTRKRKEEKFEDDDDDDDNEGVTDGVNDGGNEGDNVDAEEKDIVEADEKPANDTLALPAPPEEKPKNGKMSLGEEIDFTDDDDDW